MIDGKTIADRHSQRIEDLKVRRAEIQRLISEFNNLQAGYVKASRRDFGYADEGEQLDEDNLVKRAGSQRMGLTYETTYPIIVGKKKNGEWSKQSNGTSLFNKQDSWSVTGDLLWGVY